MRNDLEQGIIERVLQHLSNGSTDQGQTDAHVPVDAYLSPERFASEQELIFRRQPIAVAPASQLASPGDFVTGQVASVPFLICRDREGVLRGFHNVCRHRGTRLVDEAHGKDRFTHSCPYHAWTYASDGRLIGMTHPGCFPGVDPAQYGLGSLPVDEAAGLVFIQLHGGVCQARAHLDGILADVEALGLGGLVHYRTDERIGNANWKVFVEGGLETYHFRFVHNRTIYPAFFDNVLVTDLLGPHQRLVLPRRSIASLRGLPAAERSLRPHAHFVYLLFPNTLLLVQPDHVVVVQAWPRTATESRIVLTMLIPADPGDAGNAKTQAHWRKNRQITLTTLNEDFDIGERVQAGLSSGALDRITLGRNELGIAGFHAAVAQAVRRGERHVDA